MPKAKSAAKAVDLDDTLAEAHASLGYVSMTFDWDWPRAEREFRRALELNPNSSQAHPGYAQYLFFVGGHPEQAIEELRRAYALDPLLPQAHGDLEWFLFLTRRQLAVHLAFQQDHAVDGVERDAEGCAWTVEAKSNSS